METVNEGSNPSAPVLALKIIRTYMRKKMIKDYIDSSLKAYINEINSFNMLSFEDEMNYIKEAQKGN